MAERIPERTVGRVFEEAPVAMAESAAAGAVAATGDVDIKERKRGFCVCDSFSKKPGSSSTSIFDHSALLLMSVSMSFMEVNDL